MTVLIDRKLDFNFCDDGFASLVYVNPSVTKRITAI